MDQNNIIPNGEMEEGKGTVKIATEVVTAIAGVAAAEVEGVIGISSGTIAEGIDRLLRKKSSYGKGIRVQVSDNSAVIDVDLIVEYGCSIPSVALSVQEKVKEAVETMTGLEVELVNIHVNGVDFRVEQPEEQPEQE